MSEFDVDPLWWKAHCLARPTSLHHRRFGSVGTVEPARMARQNTKMRLDQALWLETDTVSPVM